jgi:hypothetical protein
MRYRKCGIARSNIKVPAMPRPAAGKMVTRDGIEDFAGCELAQAPLGVSTRMIRTSADTRIFRLSSVLHNFAGPKHANFTQRNYRLSTGCVLRRLEVMRVIDSLRTESSSPISFRHNWLTNVFVLVGGTNRIHYAAIKYNHMRSVYCYVAKILRYERPKGGGYE